VVLPRSSRGSSTRRTRSPVYRIDALRL